MNPTPQTTASCMANQCLSVRIRLINRLVGAIYDQALRHHGIRATQLNILVAVSVRGESTSKQLCRMLQMDSSTFSRALQRMKTKGWLRVQPSGEGKILNVIITREGLAKIEAVYPDWQKAQTEATRVLGESMSEMIMSSGNSHLRRGMTG